MKFQDDQYNNCNAIARGLWNSLKQRKQYDHPYEKEGSIVLHMPLDRSVGRSVDQD